MLRRRARAAFRSSSDVATRPWSHFVTVAAHLAQMRPTGLECGAKRHGGKVGPVRNSDGIRLERGSGDAFVPGCRTVRQEGVGGEGGEPIAAGMVHRQGMTAQRVPLSAHWSEASSPPAVGCASPRRVYEEPLLDMAATIRPITSPDIGEERSSSSCFTRPESPKITIESTSLARIKSRCAGSRAD